MKILCTFSGEHDANRNPENQVDFNSDLFNSLNLNDITIEDIGISEAII